MIFRAEITVIAKPDYSGNPLIAAYEFGFYADSMCSQEEIDSMVSDIAIRCYGLRPIAGLTKAVPVGKNGEVPAGVKMVGYRHADGFIKHWCDHLEITSIPDVYAPKLKKELAEMKEKKESGIPAAIAFGFIFFMMLIGFNYA